jgi:dienelactone hydrolase
MIVAPGGGNRTLMMSCEGVGIAKQLNDAGVDAFVLKYRLRYVGPAAAGADPTANGPQAGQNIGELSGADGRRAVEVVRTRATEFKVQPDRVGMIGFSAGGGPIRAAMHGAAESRPDFVALIYAAGNRGGGPVPVPEGAPPLFLAVAADDPNFIQGSIDTFLAWRAANIPAELHIFQMGAHGFVDQGGGADHFMDRVQEWMQVNGWLTGNE